MNEQKWVNRKGQIVHPDNVPASEKIKDDMVAELIGKAQEIKQKNLEFKAEVVEDIDNYISLMRDEYNLNPVKGVRGNMAFETFDGLKKITVSIQDTLEFDEKLVFAKEKIDEFLTEEAKSATANIQTLILKAFEVDKKGSINVKNILTLKSCEIDHPLWQEAMKIIDDSTKVSHSQSYLRFYEKKELGGKWEHIVLDASKI